MLKKRPISSLGEQLEFPNRVKTRMSSVDAMSYASVLDPTNLTKKRSGAVGGVHGKKYEIYNVRLQVPLPCFFVEVEYKSERLVIEPEQRFKSEVLDRLWIQNFGMRYALECAYKISFKLVDELDYRNTFEKFRLLLERMESENVQIATRALYDLFYAIDSHEPVSVCDTLEAIFEEMKREGSAFVTYDNMCEVRRCILTPTRMIFLPPILHAKSRFLRNYDPEYALWVHLRDDDLSHVAHSVRGDEWYKISFFHNYIVGSLLGGIRISDRNYEFLGCSSSQLRDCGMFLYATDNHNPSRNSQFIRQEVGELVEITNVAKYLARFGQAFSQPMGVYKNPNLMGMVETEPDIERGRHPHSGNHYNFTDGCGRISEEVAQVLCASLRRNFSRAPSAYQVRQYIC